MVLAWWLADVGLQDIAKQILKLYPEPQQYTEHYFYGMKYWLPVP